MNDQSHRRKRELRAPSIATTRTIVVLLILIVLFSIISPRNVFFSVNTLINVSLSAATIVILACGATLVLVSGQLDLSIGSQLLLSSILGVAVMQALGGPGASWTVVAVGALVSVLVGMLFGLINGLLTVFFKVPSFIVTLGTGGAGLGAAQLLTSTGGSSSQPAPAVLAEFGTLRLAGIPATVVVAALIALFAGLLLAQTRFGLHIYATGSNADAARRSGVRVKSVHIGVFVLMGIFSALAGLMDLARFTTVSTTSHQGDALTALAAVIIGGASLFGGRGTIFGTVLGSLVPIVLLQGFVIQGVNPFWQSIAIGAILVFAVAVDSIGPGSTFGGFRRARERVSLLNPTTPSPHPSAPPEPKERT